MSQLQFDVDVAIATAVLKADRDRLVYKIITIRKRLVAQLQRLYRKEPVKGRGDVLVPEADSYVTEINFAHKCFWSGGWEISYQWCGLDPATGKPEGSGLFPGQEAQFAMFEGPADPVALTPGMYFDRIGNAFGRYGSPCTKTGPSFTHRERGLPYLLLEELVQREPAYHRYRVVRGFSNSGDLELAFRGALEQEEGKRHPDVEKKERLVAALSKIGKAKAVYFGKIRQCFGDKGGGDQYRFPCSIQALLDAGLIQEE